MKKNKENLEELKKIVSDIKQAIAIYNNLNPDNKLALIEDKDNLIDTTDIYICRYDHGDSVDLFKRITFDNNDKTGLIFKSVYSDNIGIIFISSDGYNRWENNGCKVSVDNEKYVSNCELKSYVGFDEMRLIMLKSKKIENYTPGLATKKEMFDVLKFAFSYYKLEKKHHIKRLFRQK